MTRPTTIDAPHVWVNLYKECDRCNYNEHRCYFCGTDLDHEGFEASGIEHTVAYCRPDLVEHEAGDLCTWPVLPDMSEEWNREHGRPGCYWDHEKGELKP